MSIKFICELSKRMRLIWFFSCFGLVLSIRNWTLRNVNSRSANPKEEIITFEPDMPAIRIIDESSCQDVRNRKNVVLRIVYPHKVAFVTETALDEFTKTRVKSCFVKPSGTSVTTLTPQPTSSSTLSSPSSSPSTSTPLSLSPSSLSPTPQAQLSLLSIFSSAWCDVCSAEHCWTEIALPCNTYLFVSRWRYTRFVDITIDQGKVVNCTAVCDDIGYYDDEIPAEIISMEYIVFIIIVIIIGSLSLFSLLFLHYCVTKKS